MKGDRELLEAIAAMSQRVEEAAAALQTSFAETVNGVVVRAARAVQLEPSGNGRLTTAAGRLVGFALRETSGAASAVVVIRDGADATGAVLAPVTLGPGESVRDWFGPAGVNIAAGCFVHIVSGAVEGAVYLGGPQ